MKIEKVDPNGVVVPHRLRAVDGAKVAQIAQSMKEIGLQQPITVWEPRDGECELIAGAHRLEGAKSLGWEWIECVFKDDWSDIDRQLWEIDENLMRAELTPTQQAEHLAKRQELWTARKEAQKGLGGNTVPTKKPQHEKAFAAETAEATGVSKRHINKAIARAEAVPEDVRDQIRGTKLDTGVYLDRLKGMTHDDQRERVASDLKRLYEEGKKPPPIKKITPVVDADEEQLDALKRAWNKASSEARRRFDQWREEQETPVFDVA